MRRIREVSDRPMRWSRPRLLERRYTLQAGDDLLAVLRWESLFSCQAVAETADGTWVLQRTGFFRSRVVVRAVGSDTEVATVRAGWSGTGEIQASDHRRYRWRKAGFWSPFWFLEGEDGLPLVEFERAFLRRAAAVRVQPSAGAIPDLALLVALGWYLLVLADDDAAGAAAAALAG